MRSIRAIVAMLAMALAASACAPVAPYQRGYLARDDMALDANPGMMKALEKTFEAKERRAAARRWAEAVVAAIDDLMRAALALHHPRRSPRKRALETGEVGLTCSTTRSAASLRSRSRCFVGARAFAKCGKCRRARRSTS